MTGFGPLFQLQVAGSLCPCFERSENRNARLAVAEINQKCRQVDWQMPNSNGSAGSFLGGLFQRNNTGKSIGGACRAKLILQDSGGDGKPEIYVDPCVPASIPIADAEHHTPPGGDTGTTSPGYKLNIKLRRVDKVLLEDDQIVLYARKAQSTQPAKELVRFVPLQCGSNDDNPNTAEALPMVSDARNMLVHHFMVIVEWERQRTKDDYDDDDDDDENQPNFLQARAQKAAHFAKREIEMQKTRKEREKRKAKLVAEAGGLKYTAMAMANNSSIT